MKLKRSETVLPLLAKSSTLKVHEEVPVDPVLLFPRMNVTKAFEDEIEKIFAYDLAPFLLSLFDADGMHETAKSAMYYCFKSVNAEDDRTNAAYIIDGGYLLHHVVYSVFA